MPAKLCSEVRRALDMTGLRAQERRRGDFPLSIPCDSFNVERTKEEPSRQAIRRSRHLKH